MAPKGKKCFYIHPSVITAVTNIYNYINTEGKYFSLERFFCEMLPKTKYCRDDYQVSTGAQMTTGTC